MADNEDQLAQYQQDAEYIVNNAPTYEAGVKLLQDLYKETPWEEPDKAAKILQDASSYLTYKDPNQKYNIDQSTTENSIARYSIDEIDVADPLERINEWERKNIEDINQDTDVNTIAFRDRFTHAITRAAKSKRRQYYGLDSLDEKEAREDYLTNEEGIVTEIGRKTLGGLVASPLSLAGYKQTAEKLTASSPEDGFLESLPGDLASGLGFLAGTAASSSMAAGALAATGAAVGATVSAPALIGAGVVGASAYVLSGAVDAIMNTYQQSVIETGSKERAARAAEIEGGAQAIMALAGGKTAVNVGKRLLSKKLTEDTFKKEALAAAGVVGISSGVGGAVSGVGQGVALDDVSIERVLSSAGRQFITGTVLAPTAVGVAHGVASLYKAPAEIHTTPKGEFAEKVYGLSPEIALKIEALKNTTDAEGEKVKIYIDERGFPVAQSKYLRGDLTLSNLPEKGDPVAIPVGIPVEGQPILETNKPRVDDKGSTRYASRIGKSTGAASVTEFGKEPAAATRIRTADFIDEEARAYLGDKEGPGLKRIRTRSSVKDAADARTYVNEIGLEKAAEEYLNIPYEVSTEDVTHLGEAVIGRLQSAIDSAVSEGNSVIAGKLRDLFYAVTDLHISRRTKEGRVLEAAKAHINSADRVIQYQRNRAYESAVEAVAVEDKVSPEEVKNTSKELTRVNQELDALNKQTNPELVKLDQDIKTLEDGLKAIEEPLQEKVDKQTASDEQLIADAVKEKDRLLARQKELEDQLRSLEQDLASKERDLVKTEKEAQAAAKKRKADDLAAKETALEKVRTNPKSRIKPETLAKMEDNLTAQRAAEPVLTSEEKAAINSLKKEVGQKKAKLETAKKAVPESAKKTASDITELDKLINQKKADKQSRTVDSVANKTQAKERNKLKTALAQLNKERADKAQKSSENKSAAYKDLLAQREKLEKRQAKLIEKTETKVEENLPLETRNRLRELQAKVDKYGPDSISGIIAQTEINKINHEAQSTYKGKLETFTRDLNTFYVANILFRGSTQAANLAFNLLQVPFTAVGLSAAGFGKGASVLDGMYYIADAAKAAGRSGVNEAFRALIEGKEPVKTFLKNQAAQHAEMRRLRNKLSSLDPDSKAYRDLAAEIKALETKEGRGEIEAAEYTYEAGRDDPVEAISRLPGGRYYAWLGYSLRGLSAADAIFTRSGYEAEAAYIARKAGRRAKAKDLDTYVAEQLFNSKSDWENALLDAKKEAEDLRNSGIEISNRDIKSIAWANLDKKRNNDLRGQAAYAAGLSWLNQDITPRGTMGFLSSLLAKVFTTQQPIGAGREISNVAGIVQPFVNTFLKVANLMLNPTPIGIVKAGAGKLLGEPSSVIRSQLGQGLAGTMFSAYLIAELENNKDKEDPWFDIIGKPDNRAEAELRKSLNIPNYSIKLGDTYYPFLYTPLAANLAMVAAYKDYSRKNPDVDYTQLASILALANIKAFGELPILKSASALLDAIQEGKGRIDAVKNIGAGIVRGFIPGTTVLEEIDRAFANPTATTNDFFAKLFRATPMAYVNGKPALNVWGEPVERNALESFPLIGSLSGRFVKLPTNDPEMTWLVNTGYAKALAVVEPKVTIASNAGKSWQVIRRAREANLGAAYDDVLTEDARYKMVEELGPILKQIVRRYRTEQGDRPYNATVEKSLKEALAKAKNSIKKKMFIEGTGLLESNEPE